MKRFTLLILVFCAQIYYGQSITYLSPLTESVASNEDSPYLIPNGVVPNPAFDYYDVSGINMITGSLFITADEMATSGFEVGDQIGSIALNFSQGQAEITTGVLSIFFLPGSFLPTFDQIPGFGYNLFPNTEILIPNQAIMVELPLQSPMIYDGSGLYITFYFTPTSLASTDQIPLVGVDTNLPNGFRSKVRYGESNQSTAEVARNSRPVVHLGKIDCPIPFISFTDNDDYSVEITWEGSGTYEVEYGIYPYEQGTGGTTLPIFVSESEPVVYQISGLEPGTAYDVYVRSICSEEDSSVSHRTAVGTTLSTPVSEFPYYENFSTYGKNTFVFTRGWQVPSSTTPHLDWRIREYDDEGALAVHDYMDSALYKLIYSRALQLEAGITYEIEFDYALDWYFPGETSTVNSPNLSIIISSTESADVYATLEGITNFDYENYSFEFTPEASGLYFIGLNAYFAPAGVQYATNYLIVDNFRVEEESMSTKDLSLSDDLQVYPNPFHDVIQIKSKDKVESVQVYDMSGALVYENKLSGSENKVNLSGLKTGVYVLKVQTSEGVQVRKIMKQ